MSSLRNKSSASLTSLIKQVSAIGFVAAVCFAWPISAQAVDIIDVVQSAALDQPQINFMLSRQAGANTSSSALRSSRLDLDLASASGDIFGSIIPDSVNIQAYFDTGASGILIGQNSATTLGIVLSKHNGQDVTFTDIGVAGTDTFGVSEELYIGLANFTPSTNVDDVAGYQQRALPIRAQVGPIRPTTDPSSDQIDQIIQALTGQEFNVVGMPAMTGKVVVIDAQKVNKVGALLQSNPNALDELATNPDLTQLTEFLNNLSLRTYVYDPNTPFQENSIDDNPGIPTSSHRVKLSYASFDQFTQVGPDGAAGPTLAHNPFIGPNPVLNSPGDNTPKVKIGMGGQTVEGSFLLDTGAAVSMISTDLAQQLNVRYTLDAMGNSTKGTADAKLEIFDPGLNQYVPIADDKQFQLEVGGIGGQTKLAGFFLDSLTLRVMAENGGLLPEDSSEHLNFLGAPVLVHDITLHGNTPDEDVTLDGILGMNFLVGSVNIAIDGLNIVAEGYSPGVFDWITFDEPNGILGLTMVPEPGTWLLAASAVVGGWILRRRARRR